MDVFSTVLSWNWIGNRGWNDIINQLLDLILQFFYMIFTSLCTVIYWLEQTFYYLSGARAVSIFTNETVVARDLIQLFPNFNVDSGKITAGVILGDSNVQNTILALIIIAAGILLASTIYAIVKAHTQEAKLGGATKTVNHIYGAAFKSILGLIFMPIIALCAMALLSSLFSVLIDIFVFLVTGKVTDLKDENSYVATMVFNSAFEDGGAGGLRQNGSSAVFTPPHFYKDGRGVKDFGILLFQEWGFDDKKWGLLDNYNMGLGSLIDANQGAVPGFNYLIALVAPCFVIVALGLNAIRMAERLIEVTVVYLMGPFNIATTPADDGARAKAWKEQLFARYTVFMGNVICMFVYLRVINLLGFLVTGKVNGEPVGQANLLTHFIYIVLLIGGAFAAAKGGNLIAQMISQTAGSAEASSMAQSQGLMHQGASLAKSVGRVALGGAGAILAGGLAQSRSKNGASLKNTKIGAGGAGTSLTGGTGSGTGGSSGVSAMASGALNAATSGSADTGGALTTGDKMLNAFKSAGMGASNRMSGMTDKAARYVDGIGNPVQNAVQIAGTFVGGALGGVAGFGLHMIGKGVSKGYGAIHNSPALAARRAKSASYGYRRNAEHKANVTSKNIANAKKAYTSRLVDAKVHGTYNKDFKAEALKERNATISQEKQDYKTYKHANSSMKKNYKKGSTNEFGGTIIL